MSERSITRREFITRTGAGVAGAYLLARGVEPVWAEGKRPNIIFILTDDQRWDAMSCSGSPYVVTPNMDRLAKEGARFTNAFVTTSLCSPSRASFLTGKYVHSHGVIDNRSQFPTGEQAIFPQLLQKAGYETAFFGKWHMDNQETRQPGFNRWFVLKGQGRYNNPRFNIDGTWTEVPGYITDILTKNAVEWMKQKRQSPFCLYLSHKAIHAPFSPAVRHSRLYENAVYPLPPSARDNMEGKPARVREKSPLGKGQSFPVNPERFQERVREYHRTLAAADDSVGRVLDALQETGQMDNTIIVFAGDNGFFWGEHGLGDKRWAYDEALRIPFVVRFPRMLKPGRLIDQMVLNIDVAPTLLDVAGVPVPSDMQGRSFKPLLEGKNPEWRDQFLYEYFVDRGFPEAVPEIHGVRTTRWKYITYPRIEEIDELYDLRNDPYEMHNLAQDTRNSGTVAEMKDRMASLMKSTQFDGASPKYR